MPNLNPKNIGIGILAIALVLVGAFSLLAIVPTLLFAAIKLGMFPAQGDGFLFLAYAFALFLIVITISMLLSTTPFTAFQGRLFATGSSPADGKFSWLRKKRTFASVPLFCFCLGCGVTSFLVHNYLQPAVKMLDPSRRHQLDFAKPYLNGGPAYVFIFKSGKSGDLDITRGDFSGAYSSHGSYPGYLADTVAKFKEAQDRVNIASVEVIGYADAPGAVEANQRLSKERAETVRNLLKTAGVPEAIISTRAAGVRQGACEQAKRDQYDPCRYEDRRVEVYIRGDVKRGDAAR